MNLGNFRKLRLVNLIVCLAFCLNFGFSNSALAFEKVKSAPERASMLRPKAASENLERTLVEMGIDELRQTYHTGGAKGLKATLADRVVKAMRGRLEEAFIRENIVILEKKEEGKEEGKIYIVSRLWQGDNDWGWSVDLSKDKVEVEHYSSKEAIEKFLKGGQRTWVTGKVTSKQLGSLQEETSAYLEKSGMKLGNIFRKRELAKQVAAKSVKRVEAGLAPLSKAEQEALVKELETAFAFHDGAIGDSLTQEHINAMMAIGLSPESMVKVGAETFSLEGGAAVGSTTLDHLKEIGIEDSLVGHSATRYTELYKKNTDGTFEQIGIQKGDTDSDVREKIKAALQSKSKIILCVGETLKIREKDKNAKIYSISMKFPIIPGSSLPTYSPPASIPNLVTELPNIDRFR